MAYPETGASYRHTPKFIDRMRSAENAGPKDPMNELPPTDDGAANIKQYKNDATMKDK